MELTSLLDQVPALKRCSRCKEIKPVSLFHKNKQRGKPRGICKACNNLTHIEYNSRNAEREKSRSYAWKRANHDKCKRYRRKSDLKKKYGLSIADYGGLLELQDNRCAVCRRAFSDKNKPYVDHCHSAGHVRGLLCNLCNTAEGHVRTTATAKRLWMYMQKNELFENNLTRAA